MGQIKTKVTAFQATQSPSTPFGQMKSGNRPIETKDHGKAEAMMGGEMVLGVRVCPNSLR